MNSLQKLQKILGPGYYSCGSHCWRVNGILITYWHLFYENFNNKYIGNSVKIYRQRWRGRIQADYFPFVNEMCIDEIQNIKMFGHRA